MRGNKPDTKYLRVVKKLRKVSKKTKTYFIQQTKSDSPIVRNLSGVFCFFVALSGSSPLIVALNTFIKQKPIFGLYVIISLFINGFLIAEMDYYED